MALVILFAWPVVALLSAAVVLYSVFWLPRTLGLCWGRSGRERLVYGLLCLHLAEPLLNGPLIGAMLVYGWGTKYPADPLAFAVQLTAPMLVLLLPALRC